MKEVQSFTAAGTEADMTEKTEAQKRAQKTYMEKFARLEIRMEPEQREIVRTHAESRGESVNAFVVRAIVNQIERDSGAIKTYIGRDAKTMYLEYRFEDCGMERHLANELTKITHILTLDEVKKYAAKRDPAPVGVEMRYQIELRNEFCPDGIELVDVIVEYDFVRGTYMITIDGTIVEGVI